MREPLRPPPVPGPPPERPTLPSPPSRRKGRTSVPPPASAPIRRRSSIPGRLSALTGHRSGLPPVLPLFDPEHFHDPGFFRALAKAGCKRVLLGGTGCDTVKSLALALRYDEIIEVVLYPGGPDSVCRADLIVLPEIMNSDAPTARPFGPAAVATAMAVRRTGSPHIAAAHFIQGDSTAARHFRATPLGDDALLSHIVYATMHGYQHVALDYEGAAHRFTPGLAERIKRVAPRVWLTVSDDVSPDGVRELRGAGVDTVIVPSDRFEASARPVDLVRDFVAAVA